MLVTLHTTRITINSHNRMDITATRSTTNHSMLIHLPIIKVTHNILTDMVHQVTQDTQLTKGNTILNNQGTTDTTQVIRNSHTIILLTKEITTHNHIQITSMASLPKATINHKEVTVNLDLQLLKAHTANPLNH